MSKFEIIDLLSPIELQKAITKNISNIKQNIEKGNYIQVKDYAIKGQTPTLIKKFLINKCQFMKNDKLSGLYVFFELDETLKLKKYLYVGISRNLIVRLKDHVSGGDPSVASFAVLMARNKNTDMNNYFSSNAYKSEKNLNLKESWIKKKKELVTKIQKEEMQRFYLTAIPIDNYQELHATECFLAGEFKCEFNSFKTH